MQWARDDVIKNGRLDPASLGVLTHYPIVTPYGDKDIGQQ